MGYFDSTIYIKSQEYYRLQLMFIYSYLELFICSYANHAIIKDKFYHIGFRLILSYFCFFFLFSFFRSMLLWLLQSWQILLTQILIITLYTMQYASYFCTVRSLKYVSIQFLYKYMGYFGMWHILNKWIDKFIYLLDHIFYFIIYMPSHKFFVCILFV